MLRYWAATVTHCIDLTARGSTWTTSSTSSSSFSPSAGPSLSAGQAGTTGEGDVTTCPPALRTGELWGGDDQDDNPSVKLWTKQWRPDRAGYSSPQDHQLAWDWHLLLYAVRPALGSTCWWNWKEDLWSVSYLLFRWDAKQDCIRRGGRLFEPRNKELLSVHHLHSPQ